MTSGSRLAAAGIMAAVFLSGAVTGAVLSRTVLDDRPSFERSSDRDGRWGERPRPDRRPGGEPDRDHREGPRPPRGIISSRAVEHLAARLDLSEPQRASLDSILERQRERASAVFREVGPRLRTVLDSTNAQIRMMLDSAQQAEFDAIIREDREVLGRRFTPRDSTRRR